MKQTTKNDLMTIAEYAATKGVSVQTIYNWIEKKDLKTRKVGKITLVIVN